MEVHLTYFIIIPGRRSKFLLIISNSSLLDLEAVPYVSKYIDNGSATPIAYEICRGNKASNL